MDDVAIDIDGMLTKSATGRIREGSAHRQCCIWEQNNHFVAAFGVREAEAVHDALGEALIDCLEPIQVEVYDGSSKYPWGNDQILEQQVGSVEDPELLLLFARARR